MGTFTKPEPQLLGNDNGEIGFSRTSLFHLLTTPPKPRSWKSSTFISVLLSLFMAHIAETLARLLPCLLSAGGSSVCVPLER